jgi:hypothetical protein
LAEDGERDCHYCGGISRQKQTLYRHIRLLIERVFDNLITRYITFHANLPFPGRDEFPECGLIVDATVQKRPQPAGPIPNGKEYFSGKHHIHCLKSQVIISRAGVAVHIVAGVPGAKHDFQLFREHLSSLEEFIDLHRDEPCHILADKGYIGHVDSETVHLVTPHKPAAGHYLTQEQIQENYVLSQHRVLVENYFGRLSVKFHILVRV